MSNEAHRYETSILLTVLLGIVVLIYLFSDYLGVWSGLCIGLFVAWNIGAWSRRWYVGADFKWYRTW